MIVGFAIVGIGVVLAYFLLGYSLHGEVDCRMVQVEKELKALGDAFRALKGKEKEWEEFHTKMLMDVRSAIECAGHAVKKADTADLVASAARMSVQNPRRIILTIEEPIKKTAKKTNLLARAGLTKTGRA